MLAQFLVAGGVVRAVDAWVVGLDRAWQPTAWAARQPAVAFAQPPWRTRARAVGARFAAELEGVPNRRGRCGGEGAGERSRVRTCPSSWPPAGACTARNRK